MKCRENIVNFKSRIVNKKNENRVNHKLKKGDLCIIKTFDSSYEKKYKPVFGKVLYKIIKTQDHTVILENSVTGQILFRHMSDIKTIDFEKMGKVNFPANIAELFEIITFDNISEMFDIPKLASRSNRLKIKIKEVEQLYNEPDSDEEMDFELEKDSNLNDSKLSDIEEESDISDNEI
jgi:hypothetical protein